RRPPGLENECAPGARDQGAIPRFHDAGRGSQRRHAERRGLFVSAVACPGCGTEYAATAIVCPHCQRLVHTDELKRLGSRAESARRAADKEGEREAWRTALAL